MANLLSGKGGAPLGVIWQDQVTSSRENPVSVTDQVLQWEGVGPWVVEGGTGPQRFVCLFCHFPKALYVVVKLDL